MDVYASITFDMESTWIICVIWRLN